VPDDGATLVWSTAVNRWVAGTGGGATVHVGNTDPGGPIGSIWLDTRD
jgi:hypothetical protein